MNLAITKTLDRIRLFGFSEVMRGTWTPADGSGRRVFEFKVDADADRAASFVLNGRLALRGTLLAEGLAQDVPAEGEMELQPLTRRRVAYRLQFADAEGRCYAFEGEKKLRAARLLESWTTLPGRLLDDSGKVVGDALLRFDLRRDLLPLIKSVRPAQKTRQGFDA